MAKWQQRKAAQRAVPIMTECENCGATEKLSRHHDDYSKPKDVRVLCKDCHPKADQAAETRPTRKAQTCEVCDRTFSPSDSHKHKTCSADCLAIRGRENAYKRWRGKQSQTLAD